MCKSLLYKVRILFHPCIKINNTLSMFNLQVSGLVYSLSYEYVKIQCDKGPHTSLSYPKPQLPPRKEVMCSHRQHCTVSKNPLQRWNPEFRHPSQTESPLQKPLPVLPMDPTVHILFCSALQLPDHDSLGLGHPHQLFSVI